MPLSWNVITDPPVGFQHAQRKEDDMPEKETQSHQKKQPQQTKASEKDLEQAQREAAKERKQEGGYH